MNTLIPLLLTAALLAASDDPKPAFQQAMAKLGESGQLAQQGKFTEANTLMAEAMSAIDQLVAANPRNAELRAMRGSVYGSFPPFLNKTATAKEDLEFAVNDAAFSGLSEGLRKRATETLARIAGPNKRQDRFPKIADSMSPLIAAASITFPNSKPGETPAEMQKVYDALEGYPGLLGRHMLASADHPGMYIIFTWWKDKTGLNAWFHGDLHQRWMGQRGDAMSHPGAAKNVPTQVAMEVFAGMPGGVQINGGLVPKALFEAQ